jgi:hypothetical protein
LSATSRALEKLFGLNQLLLTVRSVSGGKLPDGLALGVCFQPAGGVAGRVTDRVSSGWPM